MIPVLDDLFFARYEQGGRGPDAFDCFGLFAEICRRRGVHLPDHPSPSCLPQRQAAILTEASRWLRLDVPEPWCAVALRIGPWVSHVGVVLADGRHFLHANEKIGITRARLDSPLWAERIAGYYRHV